MARGRRGSHSAPVSLFSFQDIITSVMGVLLFVVLLMATQTAVVAEAVVTGTVAGSGESLAQTLAALDQQLEEIRQQTASLGGHVARSRTAGDMSDVVEARSHLARVYEDVVTTEDSLRAEFSALKTATGAGEDGAEVLALVQDRDQNVALLKGELDALRMNKRLTYIARQDYAKQPLVVEVAGDSIRFAGSPDAEEPALTLTHSQSAERVRALMTLLRDFPTDSYYVLLVCKPSGIPAYDGIRSAVSERGFNIGTDVIPEDWSALTGEEPP